MSAFSDARRALADAVKTDEVPCHYATPDVMEQKCFVLQAGDPYVQLEDRTLGGVNTFGFALVVFVIPELRSNEQAFDDLDDMLDHLLKTLPEGWGLDQIGKPQALNTANWQAFGMPVSISTFIDIAPPT